MALLKNVEQESGVVVGYWKVSDVNYSVLLGEVNISCHGYLSKAAYDSGKTFIDNLSLKFSSGSAPELSASVLAYAEARLKAGPLSGASDSE